MGGSGRSGWIGGLCLEAEIGTHVEDVDVGGFR